MRTTQQPLSKTTKSHRKWAKPLDETSWWNENGRQIWSPNNTVDPHSLTRRDRVQVKVVCPDCGTEYQRDLHKVIYSKKTLCPICSGKNIQELLPGINDLASQRADIALDWDEERNGFPASSIYLTSHKSFHWKCHTCGCEWTDSVSNRIKRNQGCPICTNSYNRGSQQYIMTGVNDLQTKYPTVALDWDEEKNGMPASQAPSGSNKQYYFRCHKCGYEWHTTLTSRTITGTGCPHCWGRVAMEGVDDLPTLFPGIASEWDCQKNGCSPTGIHPGSHQTAHWKCHECGYEWENIVQNRTRNGQGCPRCAGNVVWPGHTDLATTHPHVAAEWNAGMNGDLEPTDVSYGSEKVVWWKCKNGHEWQSAIKNRTFFSAGCPKCSASNGERLSALWAESKGFTVDTQWRHSGCCDQLPLPFDLMLYVPAGNALMEVSAVEYDGIQHSDETTYYSQKNLISGRGFDYIRRHDAMKTDFCLSTHRVLIRVPHTVTGLAEIGAFLEEAFRANGLGWALAA